MANILVVGSINMDIVNQVQHHPKPGETIKGFGTQYNPGGKGANQAVAASLSGSQVTMIGAVGQDAFGPELLESLSKYGVDNRHIQTLDTTSGMAFITVDQHAENCIILNEGANGALSIANVEAQFSEIGSVNAVLLQNEISWEINQYVIERASELGIRVYFNPAPSMEIPDKSLSRIHTLILNEVEAEVITGMSVESEEQAELAAQRLIAKGVKRVVLTLGSRGALCMTETKQFHRMKAYDVEAVDTTAAGDTFIGAFASASESGQSTEESLIFANAAAALTVTRHGAQRAIPTQEEVLQFRDRDK